MEPLIQYKKVSILKFLLVEWVGRDQATDFSQTRDAYAISKQSPRKTDVIHFIKDDSGDL